MKSKKSLFKGVGTALVTPFKDEEIDYDALKKLIDIQIEAGVEALIIGGTTGEAATLSDAERYSLFEFAKEYTAGRATLIFGTGTNDTAVAIRHTKFAERCGCDGVLLVTPYYNKGTEEGVYRHYMKIIESSSLPVILYNVPSRTGVNLGYNLLSRLAECERVVGLKEASDSTDRLVTLADMRRELPLYSGNDSQIYPTLALGGEGVISVVSNILPKRTRELCDLCFRGEWERALNIQLTLLPFIKTLFLETNPAPIKHIMARVGMISPEVRLPLSEPRASTRAALACELDKIT
ncbi:MAG: 4-hydroxy-tetrahydrodipicolinate synthase [Clostridia bacterium]|nr:4-hydroxy-tetrahydrodipicolinate synthase [Clostridia bacterium]